MDINQLFKKYRTRLVWEAIVKAAMFGFSVGATVSSVIMLISWVAGFKSGLWVALGVGAGVMAAVSVLLYFFRFRPNTKTVAARLDALGLEERMITMNELKNSDSYIAGRQREDAVTALGSTVVKNLSLVISQAALILSIIAFLPFAGLTTAMALYNANVIGDLPTVVDPIIPDRENFFEVSYEVRDEQTGDVGIGGTIEYGDPLQVVEAGKDADAVIAVEDEGWMFLGWYYENGELAPNGENPMRQDFNIRENLTYYAHFGRVEESESDSDGSGEGEGDDAQDQPQEGDSSGNQDETEQPGSSAGGEYEEGNYIKDGNTYYKENWDEYYQAMLKRLAEDGELTDDQRQIIEDYFKIIE